MKTLVKVLAVCASVWFISTATFAAEAIEGNWTTATGATASIAKCGGSFCITLKTGDYSGKQIGRMSGSGNSYKGTITDPVEDKQYSGSAKLAGNSLKMKGCFLKVFCKTQNWNKQ